MSENSIHTALSGFFETVNHTLTTLERRYSYYPPAEEMANTLHHIEYIARFSQTVDKYPAFQSNFVFMTHAFRDLIMNGYGGVNLDRYIKALEILRYQTVGLETVEELDKVTRRCIYQLLAQYRQDVSPFTKMIINSMGGANVKGE